MYVGCALELPEQGMEEHSVYSPFIPSSTTQGLLCGLFTLLCFQAVNPTPEVSEKLSGGRWGYPVQRRQEASGHSCPRLVSTAMAQETSETRGYEVGHRLTGIH